MVHTYDDGIIVGLSMAALLVLLLVSAGIATGIHWWINRRGHRLR